MWPGNVWQARCPGPNGVSAVELRDDSPELPVPRSERGQHTHPDAPDQKVVRLNSGVLVGAVG